MSAIFGLVYLDGRPVPRETIARMCARAGRWGRDGVTGRRGDAVAMGHARLAVTAEAAFESMPVVNATDQTMMVAGARLDNRDELCHEFAIPAAERSTTADGALVWRAYQRWGDACPQRLFGDWSAAVWRPGEQRLFIARDHLGITGLFYWFQPPLVAFASNVEVLFAVPAIRQQLDEGTLARYLTARPGQELDRTFFAGVRTVLPGHQVTIDARSARSTCYWRPEDAPSVRFKSGTDYVEAFLAHYRRAVRARVRTNKRVASALSSGLDSASVTPLAAEALKERGERLVALTAAPCHPADQLHADEWPLARLVTERWDNIDHLRIESVECSPVAALEDSLNVYGQPGPPAVNLYWLLDLFRQARNGEAGVLLTGGLGNGTVSWSGGTYRIAHLLLTDPWRHGLPALHAWRARRGVGWVAALRAQLVLPLIRAAGWSWHRLKATATGVKPASSSMVPSFAARMRRAERAAGAPEWPRYSLRPALERRMIVALNSAAAGPAYHAIGGGFAFEIRDPTADARLVDFCFGIPDEPYVRAGGSRMLVRDAMTGLVPTAVHSNERRGLQAADLTARLVKYGRDVEHALERLSGSAAVREYLDVAGLRRAWRATQTSSGHTSWSSARTLLVDLQTGLFLARTTQPTHAAGVDPLSNCRDFSIGDCHV